MLTEINLKVIMNNLEAIKCPTCDKENTWKIENTFRPFCSERCKMIDLGEWASETRKIPSEPVDLDLSAEEQSDEFH